jgi:hypothetical protein
MAMMKDGKGRRSSDSFQDISLGLIGTSTAEIQSSISGRGQLSA